MKWPQLEHRECSCLQRPTNIFIIAMWSEPANQCPPSQTYKTSIISGKFIGGFAGLLIYEFITFCNNELVRITWVKLVEPSYAFIITNWPRFRVQARSGIFFGLRCVVLIWIYGTASFLKTRNLNWSQVSYQIISKTSRTVGFFLHHFFVRLTACSSSVPPNTYTNSKTTQSKGHGSVATLFSFSSFLAVSIHFIFFSARYLIL